MKFRAILSSLVLLFPITLAASNAYADDLGTITPGKLLVGVEVNNKPYSYIVDEKMTGFDVDLLRAIGKKIGLSVDFRAQDFSGMLPAVASKQLDLAAGSISITSERLKVVDFSEGYLTGTMSVATLSDSQITGNIKTVAGKRIGVVQGTIQDTYAQTYVPGAEIVRFPNMNAGFLSLRSKFIDGYFIDKSAVEDLQKRYPDLNIVDHLNIAAMNLPAGYPMHKGNVALATAMNKAINELVADGTWLKLYKQYHPSYPVPDKLPPYEMKTAD